MKKYTSRVKNQSYKAQDPSVYDSESYNQNQNSELQSTKDHVQTWILWR